MPKKGCFEKKSGIFRSVIYQENEATFQNSQYCQHFLDHLKREIILICLTQRLDELDELGKKFNGVNCFTLDTQEKIKI